jgi:hypothetical protein
MVQFLPLDVTDEDSIGVVLSHIDNAVSSSSQSPLISKLILNSSPTDPVRLHPPLGSP